jgi:tetratricopeptide (TPR) repeat protein
MAERHNNADHTLCIISEAYLKAPYSNWELRAAQWAAASDRPNFALPVFVEKCKPPTILATFKRSDLFGLNEDAARARLAIYLAPAAPTRFPGVATPTPMHIAKGTSAFPGQTKGHKSADPEMRPALQKTRGKTLSEQPPLTGREIGSPITLPRGPIRSTDDRWDIFLSYRSVNRAWVLQLYDQLRSLGYEVFMDQFVLTTADGLEDQLEQNLRRSATGVLIWSERSEDSVYCGKELRALSLLEQNKENFRSVVLRTSEVELPLFAQEKLWIDFSGQPDGPSGTGLLRLLYGLRGTALSDEAGHLAATHDEAVKRAAPRFPRHGPVATPTRSSNSPRAMLRSGRPLPPCKVAEGLIALKRPDDALTIVEAVTQRFPRSVRPQQLKGLALPRAGNWKAAQQVLGELYELGEKDPETVGILARTWRGKFAESGNPLHLRRARNLYAEAFNAAPSDYYTGINAASNSVLLDEPELADKYAAAVEKLVGTQPVRGGYWKTATVAEVQLIRRRFADAAKLYAAAVEDDPDATGNHESTRDQARRLIEKLRPAPEERASVEKAFGG